MKNHLDYALEQEGYALAAEKHGDLESAYWHRVLARQGWRDAALDAKPANRAELELLHEKSLRAIAVAAERLADNVARSRPEPTQPGGAA